MAKKQLPAKGRKSRGSGSRYDRFVMIGIVIAVAAIALTLWGPLKKFGLEEKRAVRPAKMTEQSAKTPKAEHPAKKAVVAIVIDDLGQDLKLAREVAALPARITFAIMPGLPQSRAVADLARQNSREVLLHLPMEHRGKKGRSAPGMLRSDMTPIDFMAILSDDIGLVPGAVGVNNHEGSLLTENKEAMKFLMAELKARNLFFLDSVTSPKSVAFATAKEFGLKASKRDVFLDNESDNAASIRKQLEELVRIARNHGTAIGIGHPHPATISVLRTWLAEASQQGVQVVPVSKILQ